MRGVVMYSAGDVRVEDREDPKIIDPTDAVIELATCICGSACFPAPLGHRPEHLAVGGGTSHGGNIARVY